jgi:hypothetical protein
MNVFLSVLVTVGLISISKLSASTIAFDLLDQGKTDEIELGSYTLSGVMMTLSSLDGDLNQISDSFGINHDGGSLDESAQIDGDEGPETLTFSFDTAGTLDQLSFSLFGANDTLTLKKGNATLLNMVDEGSPDVFLVGESYTVADVFYLTYTAGVVAGGGASLNNIQITTVPEPSSFLLLGLGGLTLLSRRKRPATNK